MSSIMAEHLPLARTFGSKVHGNDVPAHAWREEKGWAFRAIGYSQLCAGTRPQLRHLGRSIFGSSVCFAVSRRKGSRKGRTTKPSVALLIDGDNTPCRNLPSLMEAVRSYGNLCQAMLVALQQHLNGFDSEMLKELGIDAVVAPNVTNGADKVIIEKAKTFAEVEVVALASGDATLVEEVARALASGQSMVVVRPKLSFFQVGTALRFMNQSHKDARARALVVYDGPPAPYGEIMKHLEITSDGSSISATRSSKAIRALKDVVTMQNKLEDVIAFLSMTGYLPNNYKTDSAIVAVALGKFIMMNSLCPAPLLPPGDAIVHLHSYMQSHGAQSWKRNPGNLALFLPRQNASRELIRDLQSKDLAKYLAGGGPFVLKTKKNLVQNALRRMGYGDQPCDESRAVFSKRGGNARVLAKVGVSMRRTPSMSDLQKVFSAQDVVQRYACAPRDTEVRAYLVRQGWLQSEDAAPKQVRKAMRRCLQSLAQSTPLPKSHVGLLAMMIKHIHPNGN